MTPREIWNRVRGSLGGGADDRRLSDELRFHREMLEGQYRAGGLDAAAARRAAARELGGEAQLAEAWRDQRGLPFLDMLRQDVVYGLRTLRRTPGFTVAALATLALGIGANTAIFTVIDAVLLRPLPYADPERLVTVGDRTGEGLSGNAGFTTILDWQRRSRSFETFAISRGFSSTLVENGQAQRILGARVSANFFDVLGVRPAVGRGFTTDDDRPAQRFVVLLSDRLWRRDFSADPAIVGRTITLGSTAFRVIGVMPAEYEPLIEERYHQGTAELWAPLGYEVSQASACRSCQHLRALASLKPGVTTAQATAEMNTIRRQLREEFPTDYEAGEIAVVPLGTALTRSVRAGLYVLFAAVGFVLLIACANVANLLLARSLTRRHELALRAALGAGRARILRQLLTESVMLSTAGAIAGLALASAAVRALTALAPVTLPRLDHVGLDARVAAFTAALAIGTSLVFGLYPALRGGAAEAHPALAIDSRGSVGGRSRARSLLVLADVVLALVLLAGAGLMLRTMAALAQAGPGFDPDRTLSLQFFPVGNQYDDDAAVVAFQNRVLQGLRALPGVTGAALASQIPFGGDGDCWGFHAQGYMKPNTADDPCVERYGITPDYLRVLNIPVVAGRGFTDDDTAQNTPVLLISQTTARRVFGGANPIGVRVRIGGADRGAWRTIVGVVGDVHHDNLTRMPGPSMYNPQAQLPDSQVTAVIKTSTGDAAALAGPARAVLRAVEPAAPVYGVATIGSLLARSIALQRFVMRLLAGFALVSLLLAAVGLYGVVSYGVAQRAREVGLRMALGAQRRDVVRLVLAGGLVPVIAGVVAGLMAAAAATRALRTLIYGVSPNDPLTFAGAAAVLIAVALLAHWVPLRRALRIHPAIALRAE